MTATYVCVYTYIVKISCTYTSCSISEASICISNHDLMSNSEMAHSGEQDKSYPVHTILPLHCVSAGLVIIQQALFVDRLTYYAVFYVIVYSVVIMLYC